MSDLFTNLFEFLPEAEHLLSLEPEELAGPLLLSLEDIERIIPGNIIGYDQLSGAIERQAGIKYPMGCREDVLFSLMAAWQWLEREVLVAWNPSNLARSKSAGSVTSYFVTKRGRNIKTPEDFEAYRKVNLLPKGLLHPMHEQKVWALFLQGDYDTAVFRAFKQVEIAVRKAGGYGEKDRGTDLMRKAFHVETGNLADPKKQTAEKQALSDLFAGAIGYLRNPVSHRDIDFTAEEAAKVIILASYLLQIVDSCNHQDAG